MNPGLYGFPQGGLNNNSSNSPSSGSGRLVRRTVFTANDTWINNFDFSYAIVKGLGGGGGGGGAQSRSSASPFGGSGAGGGGFEKKIDASSLGATEAVTIGAGGTAGSNVPGDGGDGGTTSFGAHCSATGGKGGKRHTSTYASISSPSAEGGIGVNGDINYRGSPGFPAGYMTSHPAFATPGGNGALPIGGPGALGIQSSVLTNSSNGNNADANSGGGGSGAAPEYNSADKKAGGNGGSGLLVVEEYA